MLSGIIALRNLLKQHSDLFAVVREIHKSLDNFQMRLLLPHKDVERRADRSAAADFHIMVTEVAIDTLGTVNPVHTVLLAQFLQQLLLTAA